MKKILVILVMLAAASICWGKDKSYETGTVQKFTVNNGWEDTTVCSGDQCTGGIKDTYTDVYAFTTADGSKVTLHHAVARPDALRKMNLDQPVSVQYRMEKHAGVNYVLILVDGKESWYYTRK